MPRNLDDFLASRPQNYAVVRRILTSLFSIFALRNSSAHFKAIRNDMHSAGDSPGQDSTPLCASRL